MHPRSIYCMHFFKPWYFLLQCGTGYFMNELANLAEKVGADVRFIAEGIGRVAAKIRSQGMGTRRPMHEDADSSSAASRECRHGPLRSGIFSSEGVSGNSMRRDEFQTIPGAASFLRSARRTRRCSRSNTPTITSRWRRSAPRCARSGSLGC